jgi:hypothetical protein
MIFPLHVYGGDSNIRIVETTSGAAKIDYHIYSCLDWRKQSGADHGFGNCSAKLLS